MDEVRDRIKMLFEELESIHVKQTLLNNLTRAGIDNSEAHNWVIEIGEIVDEYERSLRLLMDLIQVSDKERIPLKLESWLAYTEDISLFKIGDVVKFVKGGLQKYIPPEAEDQDETTQTCFK